MGLLPQKQGPKKNTGIAVSAELLEWFNGVAQSEGYSRNELIEWAMRDFREAYEKKAAEQKETRSKK